MKLAHSFVLPSIAVLAVACSSTKEGPREAQEDFEALEERLLDAPSVHSTSHLSSEGALTADVRCVHGVTRDGDAFLQAKGTLAGQPVDWTFVSDGERMTISAPSGKRERENPADLRAGLLLGLTRMGWLHNVAMLSAGGWPDATDGRTDDFVRAVNVMTGEELEVEGRTRRALTFGIEVRGQLAATAILWIDCETGVPIERWQKVQLPNGEMHVVETYDTFSLDGLSDLPKLGYSGG
jgi:hypothetical protein